MRKVIMGMVWGFGLSAIAGLVLTEKANHDAALGLWWGVLGVSIVYLVASAVLCDMSSD